ncbi:MAG: hypothetical protein H0T46_24955 [Deltaproteobacteria bacterium]|nr:hypothetical protein [Deltaproteobacteria bacterium]
MSDLPTFTPEQLAELSASEERPLSPEDFAARVDAPWTDAEREDFESLVTWFCRRYPTPAERLAATRSLAAQWKRSRRS